MKKILIAMFLMAGCTAPFFKAVDGTDTEIAVAIPNDDTFKVQLLHYLSGEKVYVKDPASITYEFKHSETNNYFGMIETKTFRQSKVKVIPSTTNNVEKLGD